MGLPQGTVPVLGQLLLKDTGGREITPPTYTSIFTMHGLIMIFWAITPILIGAFGNLAVPLIMALGTWPSEAQHVLVLGLLHLEHLRGALALAARRGLCRVDDLPPLSSNVGAPGWGQTYIARSPSSRPACRQSWAASTTSSQSSASGPPA